MIISLSVSAADDISGLYTTVTESEWNITLELKKNGVAIVELTNWLAGEYDKKETHTYKGTWYQNSENVYVTYNGVTEVLEYYKSLSLSELGITGGLPGLKGKEKSEGKRIIGLYSLWLEKGVKDLY